MSNINRLIGEHYSTSLFSKHMHEIGKKHAPMHADTVAFATSAAEELTFQFGATMERRMKSISNRNFKPVTENRRIESIEELRAIYELLDSEFTQQHLKQQARFIYEQAAKKQDLQFSDSSIPAASYIILKEALTLAISNNDQQAKQGLEKRLEALEKSHGRKIDAGLNTAEQLHKGYKDSSKRDAMRHIYYQSILGSSTMSGLLRSLLDTFGEKDLSHSIDVLSKAVLEDMNAVRPSSRREHLALKLKDLNGMNCARSLINDCKAFLMKIKGQKKITEVESVGLMKNILTMTSGSIFSNDLHRIAAENVGPDPEKKLIFLNAFYSFMKSLSQGLWNNPKGRMTGLETMLAHMENETMKLQKQKVQGH
jgi:type III secretion protein W